MMYGSSVWVSTSVDNLNKVFRLQKRAARVILNADTRAYIVDLFRELIILIGYLFHKAKINQCALVYKRLNGVCPDYMLELLKRNIDIRSTERQSRYGSLNLIFQRIKENQKVLGLFKYQPLGFGIKCSSSLDILKNCLHKDVHHFTIA